MSDRLVEVFTAGCPACIEGLNLVRRLACKSCEIAVLDMIDAAVANRARALGIRAVPAVVIDGQLAACCRTGPTEASLIEAGVGQPR